MIDAIDRQLIEAVQKGLPITRRPYAEIGKKLALQESEVIERLSRLKQQGLIKRLGVIVKHRNLGYRANAMVVFNVPDHLTDHLGQRISQFAFVTLCYQRPRSGVEWPFNLYCMIHGKTRAKVLHQLDLLSESCSLAQFNREILFSRSCFKQHGAIYQGAAEPALPALTDG